MSDRAAQAAGTLNVLHLTDPHLFAAGDGELRGVVTASSLHRVINDYQAGDWQADLVLATGDIVQDDSRKAYERFCAMLAPLGLPVFCVPGNHDIRSLMQEVVTKHGFGYCVSSRHGNWSLVGIDSCSKDRAGGDISSAEFARLEREIGSTDAAHVLVYLHHPPVRLHSRWLDEVGLDNGEKLIERLKRNSRARLALFGHAHQAYDETVERLRIIGTPSTCRQFRPLSDTFDVDERPPAWRRLSLHADGRIDTEIIWINDD